MKKPPYTESHQVSATGNTGVMNDSFTHSTVHFPTAWTSRIQTPVKRVRHGNMWGGSGSDMFGGPQ